MAMGEIASAFPTAGGLYCWASRLGCAGRGWFTGPRRQGTDEELARIEREYEQVEPGVAPTSR